MKDRKESASGYEGLANAIIIQACKDYRVARKKLRRNPRNRDAAALAEETERFFLSPWFGALTNVDGKFILQKLNEEA